METLKQTIFSSPCPGLLIEQNCLASFSLLGVAGRSGDVGCGGNGSGVVDAGGEGDSGGVVGGDGVGVNSSGCV